MFALIGGAGANTNTHCGADCLTSLAKNKFCYLLANAFSDKTGTNRTCLAQQNHELLTTKTKADVGITADLLNGFCHGFQNLITTHMPVYIIDLFEMIKVDHEYRQLVLMAFSQLQFAIECAVQSRAIPEPRQRIQQTQTYGSLITQGIAQWVYQSA